MTLPEYNGEACNILYISIISTPSQAAGELGNAGEFQVPTKTSFAVLQLFRLNPTTKMKTFRAILVLAGKQPASHFPNRNTGFSTLRFKFQKQIAESRNSLDCPRVFLACNVVSNPQLTQPRPHLDDYGSDYSSESKHLISLDRDGNSYTDLCRHFTIGDGRSCSRHRSAILQHPGNCARVYAATADWSA